MKNVNIDFTVWKLQCGYVSPMRMALRIEGPASCDFKNQSKASSNLSLIKAHVLGTMMMMKKIEKIIRDKSKEQGQKTEESTMKNDEYGEGQ